MKGKLFSEVRCKARSHDVKNSTSTKNRMFISHFGPWHKCHSINSIFQRIIIFLFLFISSFLEAPSKWKVNVIMEFFISRSALVASFQYLLCATELSTSSLSFVRTPRLCVQTFIYIIDAFVVSPTYRYMGKYSCHDFYFTSWKTLKLREHFFVLFNRRNPI